MPFSAPITIKAMVRIGRKVGVIPTVPEYSEGFFMSSTQTVTDAPPTKALDDFDWQLKGRVIVVDNGARLAMLDSFTELMDMNAFAVVTFDPASQLHDKPQLQEIEEFQIFPHALLGDGQETTLHACLDPDMSGTLPPLDTAGVLTQLPISTLRLDDIEGLDHIDWLLFDHRNDTLSALQNGTRALSDALLVQIRVPFMATHQNQSELIAIQPWLREQGFDFYGLANPHRHSHLPEGIELEKRQATQWSDADAIFVPNAKRLGELSGERLAKLAFLMDTVHNSHDFASNLLTRADTDLAKRYLIARGYVSSYHAEPDTFSLTADYSPAPWETLPASLQLTSEQGRPHEQAR